jgi:YD repeat-containing protein
MIESTNLSLLGAPTGTTIYELNALGQRVRKAGPNGVTTFHYDRQGRLIGETDAGGRTVREIIYLQDLPVGVIQ